MLFSVIIPTYNRAKIVRETILKILNQTFQDFEIIVIDDGSTDDTKEIVSKINSNKLFYHYKKNEERSIARNYGADIANGRYLIFLDSDDIMLDNHLENINNFLIKNVFVPEFIFTGYSILNENGSKLYEFAENNIFDKAKLYYGNYIGCSAVAIKKELFKQFYFNTNRGLILFEDWEIWLRVIYKTDLFCIPNKSIIMINHSGRSVLNYSPLETIEKAICLKNTLFAESENNDVINNRRTFLMGLYSYISLHVALTKAHKLISLKYLVKAIYINPLFIFKRRFYAILKKLCYAY
jgi:glycosyltransferase involved in cell wall biosynthesis